MDAAEGLSPQPVDGSPCGDALAESSERYASMFTHHPHAAYSVDRRGYYTDANPRALEMTGLSLQQMRQVHFSEVIHPDDVHLVRDRFDRAMDGVPQVVEARVLGEDRVLDVRCTAIPVVVGGTVVGVHGITEDITEAKQLQRQLEEANAAKTLFLANVSHEVRTPLATVIGATELLLDADLEPQPQHFVQMVHRSSERLMSLVNDLLDFSRLEAHQVELHPGPIDVRGVVAEVAEWACALGESHSLVLSFGVDDAVPEVVVGDGLRVVQVVTNLVQNAIKFTPSGSVSLGVRSRTVAPDPRGDARGPGTWLEFTITDSGMGIEEGHLQHLYEPFNQADPSTTRRCGGIGLGLAICRDLVDLMGGRLAAVSTLGEGTTFVFGVPVGRADDAGPRDQGP